MRIIPILLLVAVTGCNREVFITGVVERSLTDERPLSGGTVTVRLFEGGVYGEATTRRSGRFRVRAPAGETVFAEITGPGLVHTSFTGVTGLQPELEVERGVLHGLSEAELADWRHRFEGCEGVEADGLVLGEIRVEELTEPGTGEHALVTSGSVRLLMPDGRELPGCYLDEDGEGYDPDADVTGAAGVFAVAGVPPGRHVLAVAYDDLVGQTHESFRDVWVPEGGNGVVPRFPVWVTFF